MRQEKFQICEDKRFGALGARWSVWHEYGLRCWNEEVSDSSEIVENAE